MPFDLTTFEQSVLQVQREAALLQPRGARLTPTLQELPDFRTPLERFLDSPTFRLYQEARTLQELARFNDSINNIVR